MQVSYTPTGALVVRGQQQQVDKLLSDLRGLANNTVGVAGTAVTAKGVLVFFGDPAATTPVAPPTPVEVREVEFQPEEAPKKKRSPKKGKAESGDSDEVLDATE